MELSGNQTSTGSVEKVQAPGATESRPLFFDGGIDSPVEDEVCYGSIEVIGWAFSPYGAIQSVQIFLDGEFLGEGRYGYRRLDVVDALPRVTNIDCGFGEHFLVQHRRGAGRLVVDIADTAGNKLICERTVSLKEPPRGLHGPNARALEVDVAVLMNRLHTEIARSESAARHNQNGVVLDPDDASGRE